MKSCWESEPDNRPQFCELVSTISSILESAAGYLELGMSLHVQSEFEMKGADASGPGSA